MATQTLIQDRVPSTYRIDTYTGRFQAALAPRIELHEDDLLEIAGDEPDAREMGDVKAALRRTGLEMEWVDCEEDDGRSVDSYRLVRARTYRTQP